MSTPVDIHAVDNPLRGVRGTLKTAESHYPCGFQPAASIKIRLVIPCCYQAAETPAPLGRGASSQRRRPASGKHRCQWPLTQKASARARAPLPGSDQVSRGDRRRLAPGVVYLGPPAQTPAPLARLSRCSYSWICLCVGMCKHHPNFKCLPTTLGW